MSSKSFIIPGLKTRKPIQQRSQTYFHLLKNTLTIYITGKKRKYCFRLFETVLTDDKVRFGLDEVGLSSEARMAIDEFAERLVSENANVYVEVQGHTDSTGNENYNLKLGQQRAETVLRYLSREHHIPLHRISAVSYGESAPIDDNATREGRARNRRVALVVLK